MFEPDGWMMSGTFEVKLISYSRTIRKSINDTWIEWDASLCNDFQSCRIVPRAWTDAAGIMPRMCQLQIVCAATNTVFIPHANFFIFRWKKWFIFTFGQSLRSKLGWQCLMEDHPLRFGPSALSYNPFFSNLDIQFLFLWVHHQLFQARPIDPGDRSAET